MERQERLRFTVFRPSQPVREPMKFMFVKQTYLFLSLTQINIAV